MCSQMDEPKELTRTDYKIQCAFTCMYIVDPTLSGFLGSHAELVIPDGYGYVDSALYIYTYMYTYLYIIHMYIYLYIERGCLISTGASFYCVRKSSDVPLPRWVP